MNNSIFTKIVRGEVPAYKIYEDEAVLAFLDINPQTEGHTLVIPKINPAEFVWDLDDETYHQVMNVAKKVARHLRNTSGKYHVHMAVVGVDVPYAHVHLIPFDTVSELATKPPTEPDHHHLAAVAKKLRLS